MLLVALHREETPLWLHRQTLGVLGAYADIGGMYVIWIFSFQNNPPFVHLCYNIIKEDRHTMDIKIKRCGENLVGNQ